LAPPETSDLVFWSSFSNEDEKLQLQYSPGPGSVTDFTAENWDCNGSELDDRLDETGHSSECSENSDIPEAADNVEMQLRRNNAARLLRRFKESKKLEATG